MELVIKTIKREGPMKEIALMVTAIILLAGTPGFGRDLTAREIMEKNDRQMNSRDEESRFTMKLINKRGKQRKRTVQMYSKTDIQNNDKTLIRFLSPADVKGVGLLAIEDGEREDQWLYLPALKRVRRISSSEKTDSFMGSDFSYEDVEQNDLDHYAYTLLREEALDGQNCYVIQSIPVNEQTIKETAYSRTEVWIRQDNFIAARVDYFNHKGHLFKTMRSANIRPIDGTDKWRAHLIDMRNVSTGHHTELQYDSIQIDRGLDDNLFTQRYLERGR